MGPVAQWITRLTTDQKIPGSNPGRFGDPFQQLKLQVVEWTLFILFKPFCWYLIWCFWSSGSQCQSKLSITFHHCFCYFLLFFFLDFALFSSVFIFSFDMFIAGLHCWSNCVPLWQHVRPPLERKNRPPTVAISRKLNRGGDLPSQTQTREIEERRCGKK